MTSAPPRVLHDDTSYPKRVFTEGDLPLPGGVEDVPRVVRRRLTRKTPIHERTGEASPPLKRRKWLSLPGPSKGCQKSSSSSWSGLEGVSPPGFPGIGSRRHQA